MIIEDLLWNASQEEMINGFIEDGDFFICLLCGKKIEKGIVYPMDGILFEAARFIRIHIEREHGSVFEYLINLDKKFTGLSDHQNRLLKLFYEGKSDTEIQKEMGIGSSSTIRNHRFNLKEKERQAKVFLALMELSKESTKKSPGLIPPHQTATMIDDRYGLTDEENEKIIKRYFPEGAEGPLKTFSIKEKNKLAVLKQIIKRFDADRIYTEKEVNEILEKVYLDFATIRRYLIEYGFLERKPDGSQYWVKLESKVEEETVDRKKEIKQQYKEMKKEAGIYQIRNTKNQKILVEASLDLKTINGKRFQLEMGGHLNKALHAEWNEYGPEAFAFEILEVLKEKKEGFFDRKEELKKLEKKWLDKLQPYGERGYNKEKETKQ